MAALTVHLCGACVPAMTPPGPIIEALVNCARCGRPLRGSYRVTIPQPLIDKGFYITNDGQFVRTPRWP